MPFYAVETVRMLLDRGLLEPGEAGYRVTGDLSSLQVPETLQTLIAARLDGLAADERRCSRTRASSGKTFTPAASRRSRAATRPRCARFSTTSCARSSSYLDNDPLSPERGQYGFLQALVQRVAYETLSRRDRKAKHLAAAAYLAENAGIDPDEIAEVVAAHYLDAFRADEDADDAADIRASARGWLERAAERATSLAAAEEAQRAFEAAAELADDPSERARLIERAGNMARMGNRHERRRAAPHAGARSVYGRRATRTDRPGPRQASRARSLPTAAPRTRSGSPRKLMNVLGADELDRDGAALAAELARLHYFVGDLATAMARIESAIPVAERTKDMALLASTLNTKSLVYSVDRPHEAYALVQAALRIALDHDLVFEALRAYNNSMVQLEQLDRSEDTLPVLEEALDLARRRGDRQWLDVLTAAAITESIVRGRWDEAEALAQEYEPATTDIGSLQAYADLAEIAWERGDASESRTRLERIATASADPGDRQWRPMLLTARRTRCILDRDFDAALGTALEEVALQLENREQDVFIAFALRPAASLVPLVADRSPAERTLAAVKDAFAGDAPRYVTATTARLEGVLASLRGDHDAAVEQFGVALAAARSLDYVPWVAEILVDYAASLVADQRRDDAEPLLAEAREIAEALRWVRLLERIEGLERTGSREAALTP